MLNVKIFHWNTQVSMYFSVFALMISALVIYKEMKSFHLWMCYTGRLSEDSYVEYLSGLDILLWELIRKNGAFTICSVTQELSMRKK